MVGARPAGLATLFAVTVKLPDDLMLHPLGGEARELEQWLTTFHLASVVLDPYTNESSWILQERGADPRRLPRLRRRGSTSSSPPTRTTHAAFSGPCATSSSCSAIPTARSSRRRASTELPAFVFVRVDGELVAKAEGWNPPRGATSPRSSPRRPLECAADPDGGRPGPVPGSPRRRLSRRGLRDVNGRERAQLPDLPVVETLDAVARGARRTGGGR